MYSLVGSIEKLQHFVLVTRYEILRAGGNPGLPIISDRIWDIQIINAPKIIPVKIKPKNIIFFKNFYPKGKVLIDLSDNPRVKKNIKIK